MTAPLRIADIARLLGCTPAQISTWRSQSAPGKRLADNRFPAPDGQDGRSPLWNPDRTAELTAWDPAPASADQPDPAHTEAAAPHQETAPVEPHRQRPLRHY